MKTQELTKRINEFNYGGYIYGENKNTIAYWKGQEAEIRAELDTLTAGELFQIKEQITAMESAVNSCFGKCFQRAEEEKPVETKKKSFRSNVFKMAHSLYNEGKEAFAVCLKRAWAVYRLKKQMLNGQVSFAFKKIDGSLRKAIGTIKTYNGKAKETKRKKNYSVFSYFDVQKQSFRSFRIENLITTYN